MINGVNLKLKVSNFFKKYGLYIIIGAIVVSIVFTINFMIKSNKIRIKIREDSINNVETSVIDTKGEIPEQYKDNVEKLISDYFDYCNNKEYENAYVLLSDEFKSIYFKNINNFKKYIDLIFDSKKMYSIKNYSNYNNIYVYNVQFTNDILATGTTEDYEYLEDKFVIKKENNEFKLSLNGYCNLEKLDIYTEDDFMKIKIISKRICYDKEIYTVQFTNKTNNYIILANGMEKEEICLKVQDNVKVADTTNSKIVILPKDTTTKNVTFEKYFDDEKISEKFILNAIRALPEYSGKTENLENEMKKAVKLYSRTINLIPDEDNNTQE